MKELLTKGHWLLIFIFLGSALTMAWGLRVAPLVELIAAVLGIALL